MSDTEPVKNQMIISTSTVLDVSIYTKHNRCRQDLNLPNKFPFFGFIPEDLGTLDLRLKLLFKASV